MTIKTINPLRKDCIKKLNKEGYDDLARKIQEIIDYINEENGEVNLDKKDWFEECW